LHARVQIAPRGDTERAKEAHAWRVRPVQLLASLVCLYAPNARPDRMRPPLEPLHALLALLAISRHRMAPLHACHALPRLDTVRLAHQRASTARCIPSRISAASSAFATRVIALPISSLAQEAYKHAIFALRSLPMCGHLTSLRGTRPLELTFRLFMHAPLASAHRQPLRTHARLVVSRILPMFSAASVCLDMRSGMVSVWRVLQPWAAMRSLFFLCPGSL